MRFLLPPSRGDVRGRARAAVLAEWMTAWLEQRVEVELARNYRELAIEIEAERVDLAWVPPAVCARLRCGVGRLLSVIRYGASSCRAALITRKDLGILTLAELRGRRASWVDPLSTSGHLLALAHLSEYGYPPEYFLGEQVFAGSYRDALEDVAEGRADLTSVFVVNGNEAATLRELHEIIGPRADALALLCTTAAAPYDALVIGDTFDADTLERRILSLRHNAGPPAMLLELCQADRFEGAEQEPYRRLERFVEPYLG